MVVYGTILQLPVLTGSQPVLESREPRVQALVITVGPARTLTQQCDAVDDTCKSATFDDPRAADLVVTWDDLSKPKTWIHSRFRVQKPRADEACCVGSVAPVACEVERKRQCLHIADHVAE